MRATGTTGLRSKPWACPFLLRLHKNTNPTVMASERRSAPKSAGASLLTRCAAARATFRIAICACILDWARLAGWTGSKRSEERRVGKEGREWGVEETGEE